ncbi:protein piccolo-like [Schistocerca gregaria]|uniref:protein piccolo-like n=1 Tax=Schistocerca gregaria TaxID=7010 RepID=UPI00211F124E|nr:protein piccolo-like [Schistocerca gregaria]
MEGQPGRVRAAAAAAAAAASEAQQSREGRDLPGPSREGRDPAAGEQEASQGMEPEVAELPSPPQQEADVDWRVGVPQRSSSAPSLRSQEGALPPLDSPPSGGVAASYEARPGPSRSPAASDSNTESDDTNGLPYQRLSRRSSLVTVSSLSNYTHSSDQMETSNEQMFSGEDAFVGVSSSQSPMESGAELEGLPASAAESITLEKAGTSGLERGISPDEASPEEQEEPPRKKFASLARFLQQGDGASASSQQQEGEGGPPLPDGSRKRSHAVESPLQDAVKKRLLQTGRPLLGRQLSTPESCCSPASEGQEGTDDDGGSSRDLSLQEESSGDTRDVRGRLGELRLASPAPQPTDAQPEAASPDTGGGDVGPATRMPAEPPKEQQESSEHPVWQEPGEGTSQGQGQKVAPAASTLEPPGPVAALAYGEQQQKAEAGQSALQLGEQQAGGRGRAALAGDSDQRVPEVGVPQGQQSPGAERNPATKRKSTDSPCEPSPTKRGRK